MSSRLFAELSTCNESHRRCRCERGSASQSMVQHTLNANGNKARGEALSADAFRSAAFSRKVMEEFQVLREKLRERVPSERPAGERDGALCLAFGPFGKARSLRHFGKKPCDEQLSVSSFLTDLVFPTPSNSGRHFCRSARCSGRG